MNKLQVFEERELLGKDFKIYDSAENPLFLAKDVAEWIEHSNPTEMLRGIDDNEKLNSTILSAGQNREVTFLTEDGLYEVLMQSRKPIAKEFKKQVKEILKSIRKHGGYLTPQKIEEALLNPDTIIQLATNLKEERIKRIEAERINEVNKSKVLFADAVEASIDSILVRDMAKLLHKNGVNIGEKRLYQWLRDNNFVQKTCNHPTQKAVDLGVLEIKDGVRFGENKELKPIFTCMVTGKGQIYFINKLKEKEVVNQ